MFKKIILIITCLLAISCTQEDKQTLRVGTISGPETELMETAQTVAKNKYGLTIKVVEFSDYLQPNAALDDGSIDANMFQHQPFLDQQLKDKHYHLKSIGKTFVYPMGIYSQKIKNLKELKNGAIVAIPNDPSNEARALLLLEKTGLIKLQKNAGIYATTEQIKENPLQLTFKELDDAQLPRSLPDVTIAIINTNYAVASGLSPTKDAIFHENKDSPYANIIVIRADKENDPRLKILVEAIQSNEVLEKAKVIFKDQAIPAWQQKN